jgi:hypothetical protein
MIITNLSILFIQLLYSASFAQHICLYLWCHPQPDGCINTALLVEKSGFPVTFPCYMLIFIADVAPPQIPFLHALHNPL